MRFTSLPTRYLRSEHKTLSPGRMAIRDWRWLDINRPITQSLNLSTILLLSIIFLLLVTACKANTSSKPAPPKIHYGEDICEFCGMIVSEERYAAGFITQEGQEIIFDDIGDMVQALLNNQVETTAIFVHDHDNHTWIRAESAYFTYSQDLPTPMLSGLAAFSGSDNAELFAADFEEGQVLTFDELLTFYRENPPTPVLPGSG